MTVRQKKRAKGYQPAVLYDRPGLNRGKSASYFAKYQG